MTVDIYWDKVREALDAESWESTDEEGISRRSILVGTVLNMSPSGKYYTPWANSNVTLDEADKDTEYWEKLEEEAVEHGLSIEEGEGDPLDIFIVEYQNNGE